MSLVLGWVDLKGIEYPTLSILSFFACPIKLQDMGVIKVSLRAWFELNVYKSGLAHYEDIIGNSGVCFCAAIFCSCLISFQSHVKSMTMAIMGLCSGKPKLENLIKRIVVLVQVHECLTTYKK